MFFFLSKTLSYFTMPIVIICFLFLLSIVLKNKKWKNRLGKLGVIMLLFFSNDFIANEVILWWEAPPTPFANLQKKYDYGILLTGIAKAEIEPADRVYFSRGADRVTHTLQLYRLGYVKKILVSGGNGKLHAVRKQEADQIADVLEMMGVPAHDILTESKSRNTHESIMEIKKMTAEGLRPENCLLITSAFHIRRSAACYAKQLWDVDTFSTDFLAHKRKFNPETLVVPSLDAFSNWHILTREWAGFIAYKLVGYI
jgi:uncharacterized SAM-binding protein YcdF (DUF218 family)